MIATSDAKTETQVPIGTALADTTVYVLDARLVPCPEAEVGEIYLAGSALARGYLGRPDLTAERFVADPHGATGERMYRTGDLGKWLNGTLHYCGRADDQVKIRGFRVEPGETAAWVEALEGVSEAHVFATGTPDAILVAAVAGGPETATMHEMLAQQLPEYLRPTHIMRYRRLPRTEVGKLDTRALKHDYARTVTGGPDADKTGVTEELGATATRVRQLMAEVLDQPISADGDFFAHGGHSLSALRLITELERSFGVTVDLRTLFDAPNPRALAHRVDAADRSTAANPEAPAQPAPAPDTRPGPAQERMMLLHELVGSRAYTIALHWRLEATDVDFSIVDRAWRLLLERHTSLRTCYPQTADETRFEVLGASMVPLRIVETEHEDDQKDAVVDVLKAAADEPLDLTRQAPLRLFAALGPRVTDMGILVHHVATDEHGLELLQREFVHIVEALRRGNEPQLAPPPMTAPRFAAVQRQREQERRDRDLRHWRDVLSGHAGSGELPADAHGTGSDAGTVSHPVPGMSAAGIAQAAQRLRLTPFMLFHAAVALALQRAAAGDDLVLASPVAGREANGADRMVDCATNTIPIRHRGIDRGTVADLGARTRDAVLDAMGRATVSYDAVQRELGGASLSDVLVGVYQTDRAAVEIGGSRCVSRPLPATRAKIALAPTLVIGDDGVTVFVEHDESVFTSARAQGIASAIAALVAEIGTRRLDTPVAELKLVTDEERARLLKEWCGTPHGMPSRTFGELFLSAAARYADRPALTVGDITLSYTELADRARRCAARVRSLGVGHEDVVAVMTDRGVDMIVAHIAVLLSGGTFLAVDPSTPPDRVAALLRRLPPKLVVTSGCEPVLPEELAVPMLRLDHDDVGDATTAPPQLPTLPVDALAYVIFTSGTTGEPKPVGVSHRGVSKLMATQRARIGSAEGQRVLSYATPAFDASFWQLCGTLCDGGELVVMPDECRLPGPDFVDFVTRMGIDVVSVPPSVLGALPVDASLPKRVRLIVGAERLSDTLVRRWGGEHVLYNAYGPSEATVNTTVHRCRPEEPGPIPIGRVDPGARGYVVDSAMSLTPVGFPGELVIGGEGVARGYLGDSAKTGTSFVADPFATGQRCYRSGDRVMWRDDGTLEFLGRVDDQIKLRGFRVEPGEIVSVLEQLPQVRQAAVVVRAAPSGQPRLVGYVVSDETFAEAPARAALRRLLPTHLVPDRLCAVAQIPRSASGKIDRDALPEPPARPANAGYAASPETERVRLAFAETLGLDEVHPDDDFFALGGSSLTAASLLRALGPVAGRRVTFPDLFNAPTPQLLAAADPRQDPLAARIDLRPATGSLASVWLLPPLAGMSWCYTGLRNWIDPRRGLIGLQSPNLADAARTPKDFTELVTLWADLIEESRPQVVHLVGWSFGGASALGVAAQLQKRGLRTGLVAMLDAYPRAEWVESAPTPAQQTHSALRMLGVDVDLDTAERLDSRQAARLMAEANPLLSGLESFDAQRIIDNFEAGPALERSARFDGYRGDLLVFTAERTAAALTTDWRAWTEYVDGSVHPVSIDASHQDMLTDTPLSVIGPRLDRALRESE